MAFGTVACKSQWLFQLSEICNSFFFPMALPAVGDLHRAFFSASKTAAWPLQTLPCSVQWPFHLLSCKRQWLCQLSRISHFFPLPKLPPGLFKPFPAASNCQLSGICTEPFFSAPKTAAWPFQTLQRPLAFGTVACNMAFPAVGDLHRVLFFRFQDRRSPSNPSLQRPEASPPVVLQMPLALPAVGDLHRAFFSASKTATWPLQTLPCSVQWPFHLLSCKRQWLCQLPGICTVLLFSASQTAAWPRTKQNGVNH